jgi:hypothetical protein
MSGLMRGFHRNQVSYVGLQKQGALSVVPGHVFGLPAMCL